jgi:hypothetical protein
MTSLVVTSCSGDNATKSFDEKFSAQVEKLKKRRGTEGDNSNIVSIRSTIPSQSEIARSKKSYQPYVGITKFGVKTRQNYAPNREIYDLSRDATRAELAPDVFDLNYNLSAHPPFRRIGVEFDNILIPRADAYGVKTAISAKTYLSPGAKVLQKTIDEVTRNRSGGEVKNSHTLVDEKKEITRKKKMKKIFGSYNEMKVD